MKNLILIVMMLFGLVSCVEGDAKDWEYQDPTGVINKQWTRITDSGISGGASAVDLTDMNNIVVTKLSVPNGTEVTPTYPRGRVVYKSSDCVYSSTGIVPHPTNQDLLYIPLTLVSGDATVCNSLLPGSTLNHYRTTNHDYDKLSGLGGLYK